MREGRRIGVLVEEGFDDSELIELLRILTDVGPILTIGGSSNKSYRGKDGRLTILAAASAAETAAEDCSAVLVPGGYAPDEMRLCHDMIHLVKRAHDLGRVIIAVSHGPQLLISADIVQGRRVTSWPSIAIDIENAGASWVDAPVVRDGNIICVGRGADPASVGEMLRTALGTNPGHGSLAKRATVSHASPIARPWQ